MDTLKGLTKEEIIAKQKKDFISLLAKNRDIAQAKNFGATMQAIASSELFMPKALFGIDFPLDTDYQNKISLNPKEEVAAMQASNKNPQMSIFEPTDIDTQSMVNKPIETDQLQTSEILKEEKWLVSGNDTQITNTIEDPKNPNLYTKLRTGEEEKNLKQEKSDIDKDRIDALQYMNNFVFKEDGSIAEGASTLEGLKKYMKDGQFVFTDREIKKLISDEKLTEQQGRAVLEYAQNTPERQAKRQKANMLFGLTAGATMNAQDINQLTLLKLTGNSAKANTLNRLNEQRATAGYDTNRAIYQLANNNFGTFNPNDVTNFENQGFIRRAQYGAEVTEIPAGEYLDLTDEQIMAIKSMGGQIEEID